jgi:cation:H+ antiporter
VTALLFIAGLVVLVAGGELLVRGASRLAAAVGVSPLVVGLTVVAFGTSAPELAVSVQAGWAGNADIAVGNVVGSNIFNVLVILGISALVVPLIVSEQLVRLDVPIMVAASFAFVLVALDGRITQLEAGFLALALLAYLSMQVVLSARAGPPAGGSPHDTGNRATNILLMLAGLGLLVLGSRWLVSAAVQIAEALGAPELIVGLTIVAAGTSMPEVATSIIAGVRGQRDIAVGNVIGSNIFNILAVIGIAGVVTPGGIQVSAGALAIDIPIMVAVAVLCLPILLSQFTITRWEGLLFLAYYAMYMTYIILDATDHNALEEYRTVVVMIVLPLTLFTLLGFALRSGASRDP